MAGSSKGNKTGKLLEETVTTTFKKKGFEVVPYNKWKNHPEKYGKEVLLINVPYKTIYNHPGRTEFLLISEKYNLKIRIECKWQQSSGSVDEKLPYLYLNVIETMPEDEIIILIDGDGWKAGAIRWLKEAVMGKKYTTNPVQRKKKIHVFSLKEFLTWANDKFV